MVTTLTSFAIGCVLFVVFLLLKGRLAYMFIDNNEVAKAVADLSPLLAFSILLNSIQPVLSGVSVCAGWQSIVAYVNLSCYYLIGIPIGAAFGYYYHYGVKGIILPTSSPHEFPGHCFVPERGYVNAGYGYASASLTSPCPSFWF
ncbi:hypothetical protein Patl1_23582 [Pistacia atlantica]|uniref:Uncharacterized protein n=1 Tax=Pistacia atlantica TaxID=434234 RepID=A0ACC0ZW56_9ROSI|nr:hypothetical protein Patl1_23582 [Pistacia atlantica]